MGFSQWTRNFPGFVYFVRFEAFKQFGFAIAEFHWINILGGIFGNAFGNFPLKLHHCLALLAAQRMLQQSQAGIADVFHGFAQALSGALRCCGRIIQFVCQAGGKFAERHQFVALGLLPRGFANAVGHYRDQPLSQQRYSLH